MDELYTTQGAFSWCELITKDVEAAKRFYTSLFGWTTEDFPVEGMTYTVVKAGDRPVGGIMNIPPDCKTGTPVWGTYVTVGDVDATAGNAAALGGKILVQPRDIPGVGRFCVIEDPQGAVISAITYAKEHGG
jgi:predicted enzyme related to lactoylglutathione lyase